MGEIWGIISLLYLLLVSLVMIISALCTKRSVQQSDSSWRKWLMQGLTRSRQEIWGKIENIFSTSGISDESLEEIESVLYGADLSTEMVAKLTGALKRQAGQFGIKEFREFFYNFLKQQMDTVQGRVDASLYQAKKGVTQTIMVVGVNGAGKTTTIGKLATKFQRQGAKVVVGACDTFRAAAVDQLQVWCDRAQVRMIRAKEGSAPSGVAYDALNTALQEGADYCIIDTAGRLHTKQNLMEELAKMKRVLQKLDALAPHHVLLVVDAITGQNALRQAQEFDKSLGLTGLIFTKCDGSSKAGSAVSIVSSLQVPIAYIGVGEGVEHLNTFSLEDYLKGLLGI